MNKSNSGQSLSDTHSAPSAHPDRDSRDQSGPEQTMTQAQAFSQDVRRHTDGSIDFDFYRTRAIALRGEAMRNVGTLRSACAGILAMLGLLAVFFHVAAAPTGAPNGLAAVAQANAAPIR
jgi:hypothetical protein